MYKVLGVLLGPPQKDCGKTLPSLLMFRQFPLNNGQVVLDCLHGLFSSKFSSTLMAI